MNILPKHLGGSAYITHTDFTVFDYLYDNLNIRSMIDVGCGTGDMVKYATNKNCKSIGIDGDWTLKNFYQDIIIHDYTLGKLSIKNTYDLAWSVEFVEHVEEQFMDNYMDTFKKCKFVLISYSENIHGYHHVNCKNIEYWIDKFKYYGFIFNKFQTNMIKNKSSMKRAFIRNNGLLFENNHFKVIS